MRGFLLGILLTWSAATSGQIPGLPIIDFERYFPHFVATSEETRDQSFPQGVQFKLISVRDEKEQLVWVTLTRREGQERLIRVFLAKGPIEGSEKTFRGAVAKFADAEKMRFEIVDLRDVRTSGAFKERAEGIGWGVEALPK